MSALAKKMMEKYGWKEGEGLGKERSGIKSYVKVVRRDPNVATGLGHAADPTQGGSLASTHAVELDAIYGQLRKDKKRRAAKRARSDSDVDETVDNSSVHSTDSDSDSEVERQLTTKAERTGAKASSRGKRDSSSVDSSSDDGDAETAGQRFKGEEVGDITRMSDKDLFQRCGGVRLGRAGRHRFFDGKLKRIQDAQ